MTRHAVIHEVASGAAGLPAIPAVVTESEGEDGMKTSTIIEGGADAQVGNGKIVGTSRECPPSVLWDGRPSSLQLPVAGATLVINGVTVTAVDVPDWEDEEGGVFFIVGSWG